MKIIKISECKYCPYFLARQTCEYDWCSDRGGYFKATEHIPGWCRLEDLSLKILLDMDLSDKHDEDDCDVCKCRHL